MNIYVLIVFILYAILSFIGIILAGSEGEKFDTIGLILITNAFIAGFWPISIIVIILTIPGYKLYKYGKNNSDKIENYLDTLFK